MGAGRAISPFLGLFFINSYLEELVGPVNLLKTELTLAASFHYRLKKLPESL